MKIITDEQIEEIKLRLKIRGYIKIIEIINNLKEDKLRDELKRIIRNSGRTNMINKEELEILINEHGEG
jgi:hypothetical protein